MARKSSAKINREADVEFIAETSAANIGGRPRSEITGKHDEGSNANETLDGLDEETEDMRHNAEDIPTGAKDPFDKLPVFDRAEAERKP
jgi:hypothetical protein